MGHLKCISMVENQKFKFIGRLCNTIRVSLCQSHQVIDKNAQQLAIGLLGLRKGLGMGDSFATRRIFFIYTVPLAPQVGVCGKIGESPPPSKNTPAAGSPSSLWHPWRFQPSSPCKIQKDADGTK